MVLQEYGWSWLSRSATFQYFILIHTLHRPCCRVQIGPDNAFTFSQLHYIYYIWYIMFIRMWYFQVFCWTCEHARILNSLSLLLKDCMLISYIHYMWHIYNLWHIWYCPTPCQSLSDPEASHYETARSDRGAYLKLSYVQYIQVTSNSVQGLHVHFLDILHMVPCYVQECISSILYRWSTYCKYCYSIFRDSVCIVCIKERPIYIDWTLCTYYGR